jgi:hypothetical protein
MRKEKIRKPKERQRKSYRPNTKVEFYQCIVDSQDLGGEHRVSTVYFYFTHKEEKHDLHADVKHTTGTITEEATYEVSPPADYKGPFDHKAFNDAVVDYIGLIISPLNKAKRNGERFAITFPVGMIIEFDID